VSRPLILVLATLVLASPAASAAAAPAVDRFGSLAATGSRAPAAPLLPNLLTMTPTGFRMEQRRNRRLLRLTNATANVGIGPVQLDPKKRDCDGDGDFTNDRTALQRVYDDIDRDGVYDPSIDTGSTADVVGCFHFDVRHAHWHFKGFASYELARASDGAVVASHTKVGFCLLDSQRPYPGIPGSPSSSRYVTCRSDRPQGVSPGWSDVYDQSFPGQIVDVTGVPDGRYCLRSTADPADRILESNERDNATAVRLRLKGDAVIPLAGGC
jgi:Lysyl oxidase